MNARLLFIYLLTLNALFFTGSASAEAPVYTGFFSNKAVGGYDPVAYFKQGKPVEGSKRFHLSYKDADWYFSNQENLQAFKDDPDRYAPQYGGYCAWAVGHGITAKGDPLQWTVYQDRLYLNIDADIKAKWLADKVHWIEQADKNWPKVLQ